MFKIPQDPTQKFTQQHPLRFPCLKHFKTPVPRAAPPFSRTSCCYLLRTRLRQQRRYRLADALLELLRPRLEAAELWVEMMLEISLNQIELS